MLKSELLLLREFGYVVVCFFMGKRCVWLWGEGFLLSVIGVKENEELEWEK